MTQGTTSSITSLPAPTPCGAQFIGFLPTSDTGVLVRAGATRTIDVVLKPGGPIITGLNVVAAASPTVPRDQVTSKSTISMGALESRQAAESQVYVDGAPARQPPDLHQREPWNTESYNVIDENPFIAVSAHPLSTFSSDVDRASYANVRRFISEGQLPPKDAVRIEELVNYFPYTYAEPRWR